MTDENDKSPAEAQTRNPHWPSTGFEAVLGRIKAALEVNSDGELSNKFGIRRQTISQARKKGEVPPKWYFQVSEMTGCSIDWLRTGETEPDRDTKRPPSYQVAESRNAYSTKFEADHLAIIRQFRDKPLAREICRDLLELEALKPEEFRVISARIKGMVEGIKLAGGSPEPEPRQKTRRRKHSRKQTADGTDRNDGKDCKNTAT